MHVDAGEIHRETTGGTVEVGGGGRPRPGGVVPAVAPHRLARVRGDILGEQSQAVVDAGRGTQVQAGDPQTGRGQVHMAVDEGRRDEGAGQVGLFGVGKLLQAHLVAAQPRHHAVTHRHRRGLRVRRAVHAAVDQQQPFRTSAVGHCVSITDTVPSSSLVT